MHVSMGVLQLIAWSTEQQPIILCAGSACHHSLAPATLLTLLLCGGHSLPC